MHKRARPHPESDRHVVCPFCDTVCDRASPAALCSGCGARWSIDGAGEVVFDSARKADRQTAEQAARAERGAAGGADGLRGAERRRPVRLGKKSRR